MASRAVWFVALTVFATGSARYRCSYAPKMKNLSLLIGPPAFMP